MSKAIRPIIGVLVFLFALLTGGGAGFVVRGVYDRLTMVDGLVLVVNATGSPQGGEVVFPSGQREALALVSGATATLRVAETGEGAIGVNIDGRGEEAVGYVTAQNGMVVLTVGEEAVSFSQVLPGDLD